MGAKRPRVWWDALCAHPECFSRFSPTRFNDQCCQAHSDRKAVQRARRSASRPKRELAVFYPPPGAMYQYADGRLIAGLRITFWVADEERSLEVTTTGYRARDDRELDELVRLAGTGGVVLHVRSVESSGVGAGYTPLG